MLFYRRLRALKRTERLQTQKDGFNGSTRYLNHLAIQSQTGMIFQELANRLGANWDYQHPSQKSWHEAAKLATLFAGVSYERLEGFESARYGQSKLMEPIRLCYIKTNLPSRMERPDLCRWTGQNHSIAGEDFDLHLNNGRLLGAFP